MFGEVTFYGAMLAGLASFLSPCVLPLVPPYLAFLGGTTIDQLTSDEKSDASRKAYLRVILASVFFVLGFTTIFVALGAAVSVFGDFVKDYKDVLTQIAGIFLILFGLHFLGIFRIGLFYREARMNVNQPATILGAYVMGMAFAFGWTPCVGPILAAILSMALNEATVNKGTLLLLSYSLGLGIPFILAAVAIGPFMKFLAGFKKNLGMVEKVMGVLLVITGIMFLTGSMNLIAAWLLETFPSLGKIG